MDQLLRQILTELRGAWRFRWLAMIVTWLVGRRRHRRVLTLPDLYEAHAQVFVDTRDPLVAGEPQGGPEDAAHEGRVRAAHAAVHAQPRGVARETDLDLRARTRRRSRSWWPKLQT
jgi:hypothetical protein